jgi:hypothetical protein
MSKLNDKTNQELLEYQQKLKEDYETVRGQLVTLYDYWGSLEKEYNKVITELNVRYGIKK